MKITLKTIKNKLTKLTENCIIWASCGQFQPSFLQILAGIRDTKIKMRAKFEL
jgi:hypothetical protein